MKSEQLTEVKDWPRTHEEELVYWINLRDWWAEYAIKLMKANHKTMSLMFKIIKKQQRENNELREKLMKAQG